MARRQTAGSSPPPAVRNDKTLGVGMEERLQRVQIGEEVVDLFLGEHLAEAFHLVAAQADDVADPVIIRGHSACAQVLVLKNAFKARAFAIFGRISGVATFAVLIVNVAARGLLRIQAEFEVTSPALDFTCRKRKKKAQ